MAGVERLEIHDGTSGLEQEHVARYEYAQKFVEGRDVIDVACGTGYGSKALADAGAKTVVGLDISPDAIRFAESHYRADNVRFAVGDAQRMEDVADASADVVVSFETIEHVPDADAFLAEVRRVLKPGGTFIVSTPDFRQGSIKQKLTCRLRNEFHVREYTGDEFLKALNGFEINQVCGQRITARVWSFVPVEIATKTLARGFGAAGRRFVQRRYYPDGVIVSPVKKNQVPYYWVVRCKKPI
jgi:SAM-dependent methyltransferase